MRTRQPCPKCGSVEPTLVETSREFLAFHRCPKCGCEWDAERGYMEASRRRFFDETPRFFVGGHLAVAKRRNPSRVQ